MRYNILQNIFSYSLQYSSLVKTEEFSEEAQIEKIQSNALSFFLFNEETV